jgi:hypothetical protein
MTWLLRTKSTSKNFALTILADNCGLHLNIFQDRSQM